MRWSAFAVAAFVFVALDRGFMNVFTMPTIGNIAPNIVITLVVFIALFASRPAALGGAFLLGLLMDLTGPLNGRSGAAVLHLIGPNALGYLFASYVVIQLRTMVFRQRVITVSVLTAAGVLAASLVAITILVIRSTYGEPVVYIASGSALSELIRHLGIAVYSALLALLIAWPLLATTPLWAFQSGHVRRTNWR